MRRYSIANAVLAHLTAAVDCRLMFATHYSWLTSDFAGNKRVMLGHMAALVSGTAKSKKPVQVCMFMQ